MQPEPHAEPDEILLQERIEDDGILRLTLNDVGRRNALSGRMLATLKTAYASSSWRPTGRRSAQATTSRKSRPRESKKMGGVPFLPS